MKGELAFESTYLQWYSVLEDTPPLFLILLTPNTHKPNKYMYTLRTIEKGGLEVNTCLGDQYFVANRHINGGEDFRTMLAEYYDGHKEYDDEPIIAMIRDSSGNVNCIWKRTDAYIMTENGRTFSCLNRADR